MNITTLQIGNTPLRTDKFGSEALKGLVESVDESAVRKSKKASLTALETWKETGSLPSEDLATLNDYVAASSERYGDLKSEWWTLFKAGKFGKEILDIEAKMAREGNLLARHNKMMTELREANARVAVQALSGSLAGAAGVVAAYAAYSNGPTWTGTADRTTGELLESLKGLQAGDSTMITEGNAVEQVHRHELWKAINSTLDTAVAQAKAGKPDELDLQYYELTNPQTIGKIAEAAKAGNKVRVNLDAGRLSFPSKDDEGENYFSLDATPDKIRTILQLATLDADIAVSLFPHNKLINSPTNLMHRKVLRFGETTLISGMNANVGSGENVDSGYLLRGPGSKQLVENFQRDVQDSKGATLEDIWGAAHIAKFEDTNLRMGKRGLVSLFDSLAGPSPAGTILPSPKSLAELEALAEKAGATLKDLVKVPKGQYESVMTKVAERKAEVELSAKGKEMMRQLIEKAISATNDEENIKRLEDITPPKGEKVGMTRVDIADQPLERETMVLAAIAEAESFLYLPGFVVTKAVAAAIVARRDQLQAEGKPFDARVIADSGLYPHGSTPNAIGIKHLEDNGIQPRWSRLERSGWHDRKIHAKQLITDKGEITGSTNFSNQGLTENWETSAYIHLEKGDEKAAKELAQAKGQFEELWDTSFELNSRDHAAFLNRARGVAPSEWTIEEDRDRSIRHTLRLLLNFEKQTAAYFGELMTNNPEVAQRRDQLVKEGYAEGSAVLLAAKEHLGDKYWKTLDKLPGARQLRQQQDEMADWKAGKPVGVGGVPEADPEVAASQEGEEHDQLDEGAAEAAPSTVIASQLQAGLPEDMRARLNSPQFRKADFFIGNLRNNETEYAKNFR